MYLYLLGQKLNGGGAFVTARYSTILALLLVLSAARTRKHEVFAYTVTCWCSMPHPTNHSNATMFYSITSCTTRYIIKHTVSVTIRSSLRS